MKLAFDEATERFRSELSQWLDANVPSREARDEPVRSSAHMPAWAARWQRTLFDNGWLVPGWPPERGGRNATPLQQMVYFEEVARRRVPRGFNPQGISIITPSLFEWGTPEQQERWAMPTLRAELTWCLGMSEPGAGSDLAALSTKAVRHGDTYVVDGQKVWTSGAHHADLCFCFVRTDPDAPKHKGISVLVIPMDRPGIDVRPLSEYTGRSHHDFNEVFFDGVEVPAANLVGPENHGWAVAGASLANERGMLWIMQVSEIERALDRLLVEVGDLAGDPVVADTLVDLVVEARTAAALGYRGFTRFARGGEAPELSLLKLFGSELARRLYRTGADLLGPGLDGVDGAQGPGDLDGDEPWSTAWLRSFRHTIAGGTSEIQRTIIAERILGLPR